VHRPGFIEYTPEIHFRILLTFSAGVAMHRVIARAVSVSTLLLAAATFAGAQTAPSVFGYGDFAPQAKWDAAFMAVPDAKLAGAHLKELTALGQLARRLRHRRLRRRQVQGRRPADRDRPLPRLAQQARQDRDLRRLDR
jgi:hypothetical protein